jgi:hypothetical protein
MVACSPEDHQKVYTTSETPSFVEFEDYCFPSSNRNAASSFITFPTVSPDITYGMAHYPDMFATLAV